MRRRDFITLLGGAAAWPFAARAQQPGKRSRIGYLGVSSSSLEPHYVDALLRNPNNPAVVSYFEATKTAGRTLKIALDPVAEVRRADEFDNAFLAIASARPHAIAVLADRFLLAHRKRIIEFAAANRLPAMYPYREYVDAGGLISYAPSNIELFRGAATYVDKILKGAKPSDLPVQEPTKFELIVNLKTAKALGLDVPPTLLARADEVIE